MFSLPVLVLVLKELVLVLALLVLTTRLQTETFHISVEMPGYLYLCKYVGLCQVGLGSTTTAEFLAKARNIVTQHRELQNQVEALNSQIGHLEMTQLRAVSERDTHTPMS